MTELIKNAQMIFASALDDVTTVGAYTLLAIGMARIPDMFPQIAQVPYLHQALYGVQRVIENIIYHFFGKAQIKSLTGFS